MGRFAVLNFKAGLVVNKFEPLVPYTLRDFGSRNSEEKYWSL